MAGKFRFLRVFGALFLALALAACSTSEAMRSVEASGGAPIPSSASDPAKYAALVINADTGKVLYAVNADAGRYPASLTKMMTLYLLFEAMQSGRVTSSTMIPVSQHAASQPPSKLRVRAGDQIDVDTAIRALATKSANDVAVAVGEFLGGSEEQFAAQMTAKARQLGMRNTTFRSASGLHDPMQITTARDMATLGNALRKRFPNRFSYFSATGFNYRGTYVRGHNDLLGRVPGVDGIKTGFVRASGFNIVTSAHGNGKNLIVVVMGGRTGRARNAEVEALVNKYLGRSAASYANRPVVDTAPVTVVQPAPGAEIVPQSPIVEDPGPAVEAAE